MSAVCHTPFNDFCTLNLHRTWTWTESSAGEETSENRILFFWQTDGKSIAKSYYKSGSWQIISCKNKDVGSQEFQNSQGLMLQGVLLSWIGNFHGYHLKKGHSRSLDFPCQRIWSPWIAGRKWEAQSFKVFLCQNSLGEFRVFPNPSLQIESDTFTNSSPMHLHLKNHNILLFCFTEDWEREGERERELIRILLGYGARRNVSCQSLAIHLHIKDT